MSGQFGKPNTRRLAVGDPWPSDRKRLLELRDHGVFVALVVQQGGNGLCRFRFTMHDEGFADATMPGEMAEPPSKVLDVGMGRESIEDFDFRSQINLAVEDADMDEDIEWLSGKIVRLRVFPDKAGVMNLSVQETGGEILVVSQFTLFASTKKGNRPSYIGSAKPEIAVPRYERFVAHLSRELGKPVPTGEFGADMQVSLENDGPVTILIDTKQRE